MAEPLDPSAQRIIDQLPDALDDLKVAEAELEPVTSRLGSIAREQGQLDEGQVTATTELAAEHARKMFNSYGPRLRSVIEHVLGDENGKLLQTPSLEDCERIAEVDGLVVAAAGQPVVVLKPGKDWIDIGRLAHGDNGHNTGLQYSYNFKAGTSSIVLPVRNSVAMDLKTGKEPTFDARHEDDELRARDMARIGSQPEPARPNIDPLLTRILPMAEDEPAEATPGATHVLVGYSYLQQTLNRVLGFDFDVLKDSEEMEDYVSFNRVLEQQKRLEEAGIVFDIDFIDGCLAYRIDKLEAEMQTDGVFQGASTPYQEVALNAMKQKLADLKEQGWISK